MTRAPVRIVTTHLAAMNLADSRDDKPWPIRSADCSTRLCVSLRLSGRADCRWAGRCQL